MRAGPRPAHEEHRTVVPARARVLYRPEAGLHRHVHAVPHGRRGADRFHAAMRHVHGVVPPDVLGLRLSQGVQTQVAVQHDKVQVPEAACYCVGFPPPLRMSMSSS